MKKTDYIREPYASLGAESLEGLMNGLNKEVGIEFQSIVMSDQIIASSVICVPGEGLKDTILFSGMDLFTKKKIGIFIDKGAILSQLKKVPSSEKAQ